MNAVREQALSEVRVQVRSNLRQRQLVEQAAFAVLWGTAGFVVFVLFFVIAYLLTQGGKFFIGPENLREGALIVDADSGVCEEVGATPGALGFMSLSVMDETVRPVALNGVEPTLENVANGTYPVAQTLYMVTHGETTDVKEAWIDFVQSDEGQAVVREAGFRPLGESAPFTSRSGDLSGDLLLSGSLAMGPLAESLAEALNAHYPQITVSIDISNSTLGIREVGRDNVDVGLSSRGVRDHEINRYSGLGIYAIAEDGIAIVAHPGVNVSNLTINQVRDAFSGTVTDWRQLGGPDMDITVVSLDTDTGAWEGFQTWILGKNALMSRGIQTGNLRLFIQNLWASTKFVWRFLTTRPLAGMGGKGGISTTIATTVYMVLLTLGVATPIGVGGAIYLVEYAGEMSGKSGLTHKVVEVIRFAVETLAGIPSIIYGLFGFALFVTVMQFGFSMLSGALAGACLILPTIIRTTEEALLTVPRAYREGSLALGATKWQTNYQVVLPTAMPGIVTGIILGVGRIISETAVFYVTLGGSINMPGSVMDQGRTMVLHLYSLMMDANAPDPAMGTAVVIIAVIVMINLAINYFSQRLSLSMRGGS
jgi:phosphate transport system permease protein